MADQTYEGWSNWETWNVALWVDNDENLYQLMLDDHILWCAETAKEFCERVFKNGKTDDMDSTDDMLKVDYEELAKHWNAE